VIVRLKIVMMQKVKMKLRKVLVDLKVKSDRSNLTLRWRSMKRAKLRVMRKKRVKRNGMTSAMSVVREAMSYVASPALMSHTYNVLA
jgi:hypothetical protein